MVVLLPVVPFESKSPDSADRKSLENAPPLFVWLVRMRNCSKASSDGFDMYKFAARSRYPAKEYGDNGEAAKC